MEEAQEMTQEEVQKMRQEVAEEIEAEDRGETVNRRSAEEGQSEKHKTESDPWAGVNPALKAMFDSMQSKVSVLDETQARLKQAESRLGAMTNEFYAAKKAAESASIAPTKAQLEEAAKSDESWEELRGEFPEWADATDKRMNTKIAALRKELSGVDKTAAVQEKVAQIEASMKNTAPMEIQKAIVSFFHPDWEKAIATPEWNSWLKEQPAELKGKITSDKAADAVAVLDAFKKTQGVTKTAAEIAEERKKRVRASVNPQGGKAIPTKSESDMNEAELRAAIAAEVFA
jgi:hypothetical protein